MSGHVVLGAGPVGQATARALAARGLAPRVVSRTAHPVPPGAQHLRGDVLDEQFLERAIPAGAVVYQALGAPYHRWQQELPRLQGAVVARCQRAGARLVSVENVYMYGDPQGSPLCETSPHRPCALKGQLRSEMALALARVRDDGALDVCQVRASDLFGPDVRSSALGDEVFGRLARGRVPRVLGDPDAPHSWTFIDDCAETLVAVGVHRDPPPVVHVPNEPPTSVRAMVQLAAQLAGLQPRLRATPGWALAVAGWFDPVIRELPEMLYEFERPFVVSDAVARQALGLTSTPLAEAVARTVASFGAIRRAA